MLTYQLCHNVEVVNNVRRAAVDLNKVSYRDCVSSLSPFNITFHLSSIYHTRQIA